MKITLMGELGEKFGTEFNLQVKDVSEAMRALQANLKGFKEHLVKNNRLYHVLVDNVSVTDKDYTDLDSLDAKDMDSLKHIAEIQGQEMTIIPVMAGAGKNAGFIFGAILVIVGVIVGYVFGWTGVGAVVGKYMIQIGVAMMIGGVIQMLSPQPNVPTRPETTGADDPGKFFTGTINTYSQGHPVPVCYGKLRVGCAIVSLGKDSTRFTQGVNEGPFSLNNITGSDGVTIPWHYYVEAV